MHTSISRKTAAWALTGALLIGAAAPAMAGPLPGNVASLEKAAPAQAIDVRWRHRGYGGGGVAAGIAAGLIGGALIGAAAAPYYYGPGYYEPAPGYYPYPGPGYAPPVVYAPPPAVVYAPRPEAIGPGRMCWISTDKDRGYGYWRPC